MTKIHAHVTNPLAGTIYVILSAIFFSIGGVLIKMIPWSPLAISGTRSIFALIVMLIYMKLIGHRFVLNRSVLFGGICSATMATTFVIATKMTSAANAIILQFTHPIFLIFIIWIVYKKKPDHRAILTCAVALAGIICFFFDQLSSGGLIGNLLAILSGFAYAIMFIMKQMKDGDFESSMVVSYVLAAMVGVPSAVHETVFTPSVCVAVVMLGVVQIGFAYICLSRGLDAVSPVTASLTSGIEPVLNPVLVAIFYGETIGSLSMAGAVLVIGSVLAYSLSQIRHPKPSLVEKNPIHAA